MSAAITASTLVYANNGIIYNSALASSYDARWFAPIETERRSANAADHSAASGRAPISFLTVAGRPCVLKHYQRGGYLSRLVSDYYFYIAADRTRSFAEWHFLSRLQQLHLPAPLPVAARYCRHGLFYTADLITEWCRNTRTLAHLLNQGAVADSVWQAIGQVIRRYHDAGVCHADLNAHNILVTEEHGDVTLVDFDRAYHSHCAFRQCRNLARLKRSLNKLLSSGYCRGYRPDNFLVLSHAYTAT